MKVNSRICLIIENCGTSLNTSLITGLQYGNVVEPANQTFTGYIRVELDNAYGRNEMGREVNRFYAPIEHVSPVHVPRQRRSNTAHQFILPFGACEVYGTANMLDNSDEDEDENEEEEDENEEEEEEDDENEEEGVFECENCYRQYDDEDAIKGEYCENCGTSCDHCGDHISNEGAIWIDSEDIAVCKYCEGKYRFRCDDCHNLHERKGENPNGYNNLTEIHGREICSGCMESYAYCESCCDYVSMDDYMGNGYCYSCAPSSHCGCHTALEFNGISEDERFSVTVECGEISQNGISDINAMFIDCGLPFINWQAVGTDFINRSGKFAKRLAKFYRQYHSIDLAQIKFEYQKKVAKLDAEGNAKRDAANAIKWDSKTVSVSVLEHAGNIAASNTVRINKTHNCEMTRDFDLGPHAFVNSGSCWFDNSYGAGLCQFKANNGFALRTFEGENSYNPIGRIWLIPVCYCEAEDTIYIAKDDATANAFIALNGYTGYGFDNRGVSCETLELARVFATWQRMEFKTINFNADKMYNNGTTYLIARSEVLEKIGSDFPDKYLEDATCYCY